MQGQKNIKLVHLVGFIIKKYVKLCYNAAHDFWWVNFQRLG